MTDLETVEDVLGRPTAGAKAIRGTAIRPRSPRTEMLGRAGCLILAVMLPPA